MKKVPLLSVIAAAAVYVLALASCSDAYLAGRGVSVSVSMPSSSAARDGDGEEAVSYPYKAVLCDVTDDDDIFIIQTVDGTTQSYADFSIEFNPVDMYRTVFMTVSVQQDGIAYFGASDTIAVAKANVIPVGIPRESVSTKNCDIGNNVSAALSINVSNEDDGKKIGLNFKNLAGADLLSSCSDTKLVVFNVDGELMAKKYPGSYVYDKTAHSITLPSDGKTYYVYGSVKYNGTWYSLFRSIAS